MRYHLHLSVCRALPRCICLSAVLSQRTPRLSAVPPLRHSSSKLLMCNKNQRPYNNTGCKQQGLAPIHTRDRSGITQYTRSRKRHRILNPTSPSYHPEYTDAERRELGERLEREALWHLEGVDKGWRRQWDCRGERMGLMDSAREAKRGPGTLQLLFTVN